MSISGRRLDIAVPEQLAGHRQAQAERKSPGRERMA